MIKTISKIFLIQFIFGFSFVALFFLSYLLFESQIDVLIYPISIVILVFMAILYATIIRKLVQKDFINNKVAVLVFFVLITIGSTVFSLIDSGILNSLSMAFQQSYYLSDLIDDTGNPFIIFASFFAENIIKFLILLFSCKKHSRYNTKMETQDTNPRVSKK